MTVDVCQNTLPLRGDGKPDSWAAFAQAVHSCSSDLAVTESAEAEFSAKQEH